MLIYDTNRFMIFIILVFVGLSLALVYFYFGINKTGNDNLKIGIENTTFSSPNLKTPTLAYELADGFDPAYLFSVIWT